MFKDDDIDLDDLMVAECSHMTQEMRKHIISSTESRGRVVTHWPGSQEVGGSIPGCATKFVRCKNLAFNIGECVSRGSDTT